MPYTSTKKMAWQLRGSVVGLVMLLVMVGPAAAASYYVKNGGNDSAAGNSDATAWATLDRISYSDWPANTTLREFNAGDNIYLKRGSTWTNQRLRLSGSGDYINDTWITVAAYGTGAKPKIFNPPYDMRDGLMDWTEINECQDPNVIPYHRENHAAIAILLEGPTNGWKFLGLEIGGQDPNARCDWGIRACCARSRFWVENCYFHDMPNLHAPSPPGGYMQGWNVWPVSGAAISFGVTDYLTVKDVLIERCNGGIGQHYGDWGYKALFENITTSCTWNAAINVLGNSTTYRYCTFLDTQYWGHAYYGIDPLMICSSSDIEVDRCEFAYTNGHGWDVGQDCSAMDIERSKYITVQNCFIHDNDGSAFEDMDGMSTDVFIYNNVCYNNGDDGNPLTYRSPAFDAICQGYYASLHPYWSFTNNLIYDKWPGQKRNYLMTVETPDGFRDDWQPLIDAGCDFEDSNNQDLPVTAPNALTVPAPPAISSPNLVLAANGGTLSQSSWYNNISLYNVAKTRDGNYSTYWRPTEADWRDRDVWIKCSWQTPKTVDRIRIFDRKDVYQWSQQGYLKFSDGTQVNVTGGILDNGAMREVILDAPKNVTWVEFHTTKRRGAAGVAEWRIYQNSVTYPSATPDPDRQVFTINFEDRPDVDSPLTGLYQPNLPAGYQADKNALDFGRGGWSTNYANGNHYLYQPIYNIYWWDPYEQQSFPCQLVLPKKAVLKSIRVYTPPFTVNPDCPAPSISIGQNGLPSAGFYLNPAGGWRTYTTNWQFGDSGYRPQSNIVQIAIGDLRHWDDTVGWVYNTTPALNDPVDGEDQEIFLDDIKYEWWDSTAP